MLDFLWDRLQILFSSLKGRIQLHTEKLGWKPFVDFSRAAKSSTDKNFPSITIYIYWDSERGDRLEIIWKTSQIKTVKEISKSSFHSAFDVVFTQLYCLPNPNKTNSDEWLAKKCPVFESGLKSLRWWFVKRIDDILSESAAST